MTIRHTIRNRGFSLLEVLIAVVVLSFGLLALANLQASLMRNSGESKARSVALSLAKDRLEDLRSFTSLAEYEAMTESTGTFTDTAGSLGGVSYTVSTVVQRYAYDADPDGDSDTDDGAFELVAGDTGALAGSYADENEFKTLTVTVGWTDAQGAAQSVTIEDAIGSVAPENSGRLARRKADNAVRKPVVLIRDPSADAGVIPIAIGDGSETAATNPRPVIDTETAQTSFDIYTYAALLDNSGNAQAQSRVETRVVGCRCDFANADADAIAYRPTYWDGSKYIAPDEAASVLAGEATLHGGDPTQSVLCSACCRDHHDPVGVSGPKFSPRRDEHLHFDDITAEASTGEYWEACRMIRSDGIFRVAADPYNEYTNILKTATAATETDPFTDPAPDGTAADNYVAFVIDYLKTQAAQGGPNAQLDQTVADAKAEAAGLNVDPVTVEISAERWMHARGLYIDWLEAEAIEAITESQTDCPDELTTDECLLRVLPFTSINITELASWSPRVEENEEIYVANNDFALSTLSAEGAQNPVRGRVTAAAQGSSDAAAEIRTSSVGLLADIEFDVNPSDTVVQTNNIAAQPDVDAQTFTVEGLACGVPIGTPRAVVRGGNLSYETPSSCEGSDASVSLASTRVRLRLDLGIGPDAASIVLTGPGGQSYTIASTAWSDLEGLHTFVAVGDPTVAGTWTVTLTSDDSTGSSKSTELGFSVDFLYAEVFHVELTGYDFNNTPSLGSSSVTCDALTATNNPAECATVAPDVSSVVALARYNYEYVLATPQTIACTGTLSCPTTKGCKNFNVSSASVNGVAASVAASTNDGRTTETTMISFGNGFSEGDAVVIALSGGTDAAAICTFGNGNSTKCQNYSFSCQ